MELFSKVGKNILEERENIILSGKPLWPTEAAELGPWFFCFSSLFDCTWIDAAGKLKNNTMSIDYYSTFHSDFWQRLFCFF